MKYHLISCIASERRGMGGQAMLSGWQEQKRGSRQRIDCCCFSFLLLLYYRIDGGRFLRRWKHVDQGIFRGHHIIDGFRIFQRHPTAGVVKREIGGPMLLISLLLPFEDNHFYLIPRLFTGTL